jgi:hypothetical protein
MAAPPSPLPRHAGASLALDDALRQSPSLAALLQRVRESEARWAAARGALPDALAAAVRPGPIDEGQWTLLATSGAAASKLRQCLPGLAAALRARGWSELAMRVKVLREAR